MKFIKFFAWENRWIDRTLESREVEMGWLLKCWCPLLHVTVLKLTNNCLTCTARINSVFWSITWTFAPILVSVITFSVYVLQGYKLTASIAFTVSFHHDERAIIIQLIGRLLPSST